MKRKRVSGWPIAGGIALLGLAASLPPILDALKAQVPTLLLSRPWLPTAFNQCELGLAGAGTISFALYPFLLFNGADWIRLARLKCGAWLIGAIDAAVAYQLVTARACDLKDAREFCLRTIGPGLSPLKKMRRWYDKNPTIFSILVAARSEDTAQSDRPESISGYFGIIPINKSACDALDQEQLDGVSFTTDHICGVDETPNGYYLAGVAADNSVARRKILLELKKQLETLVQVQPRLFYTRPISADGLRLVKAFNFDRVDRDPEFKLEELYRKRLSKEDLHGFAPK